MGSFSESGAERAEMRQVPHRRCAAVRNDKLSRDGRLIAALEALRHPKSQCSFSQSGGSPSAVVGAGYGAPC